MLGMADPVQVNCGLLSEMAFDLHLLSVRGSPLNGRGRPVPGRPFAWRWHVKHYGKQAAVASLVKAGSAQPISVPCEATKDFIYLFIYLLVFNAQPTATKEASCSRITCQSRIDTAHQRPT